MYRISNIFKKENHHIYVGLEGNIFTVTSTSPERTHQVGIFICLEALPKMKQEILLACGWTYFSRSPGRYGEDSAGPAWTIQCDRSLLLFLPTEVDQLRHHTLALAHRRREWVAGERGNGGPLRLLLPKDASKTDDRAGEAWREVKLTRGSGSGEADRLVGDDSLDSSGHHSCFLFRLVGLRFLGGRGGGDTSRLLHGIKGDNNHNMRKLV